MKSRVAFALIAAFSTVNFSSCKKERQISFSQEVSPILKKRCVTCHYPGNEFNESKLTMESYESLQKGGVHGSPVAPGKGKSSLIIKKLSPEPPFGKQMPLMSKEPLKSEEIALIEKWIDQGAKNN